MLFTSLGRKLRAVATRGNRRAQGADVGDCRRLLRRVRQRMKSGYLWCDRLIMPRECIIRDLSGGGARIEILDQAVVPRQLSDGVRLYFSDEKVERECSVAWMSGKMLGLKFEGRPQKPSRRYS